MKAQECIECIARLKQETHCKTKQRHNQVSWDLSMLLLDHARMHMHVTLFATCWQPPWSSRLHSMRFCVSRKLRVAWDPIVICMWDPVPLGRSQCPQKWTWGIWDRRIIESECHVFYFLVASRDKLSTHIHTQIHTNSCWWKQAWVICIRVQVDSLHAREVVMWTSRMFLVDSGCLKAEQRSTAPPLYHIRDAAAALVCWGYFWPWDETAASGSQAEGVLLWPCF